MKRRSYLQDLARQDLSVFSCQLPATSCPTSCQLPASSFELPATSFELPAPSFELPAISYQLSALSFRLSVSSFELRAFSSKTPAASPPQERRLCVDRVAKRPESMRRTSTAASAICAASGRLSNDKSATRMAKYSTSLAEPDATRRNCANSRSPRRELPSAMFAAIETAARLTCAVRPNCSSRGKLAVFAYVSSTRR